MTPKEAVKYYEDKCDSYAIKAIRANKRGEKAYSALMFGFFWSAFCDMTHFEGVVKNEG